MSDINEEIVDRLLHSLRDAAPPNGMESRIVSKLQHRAPTLPASSRLPWRTASLAGGVLFAGVVCAFFLTTHRETQQALNPRSQPIFMRAADGLVTPPKAAKPQTPLKAAIRSTRLAIASPPKGELAAISYPAPPLPLTEQEKLLLRLARKGDPVQLAMLNPLQRAAQYAEERAEVQRFFHPTPSGDNQ